MSGASEGRGIELKATVVNRRKENFDVYIGRGSPFGNPYKITEHQDRIDVIEKYRKWFYNQIKDDAHFKLSVLFLRGKKLGCYCKPKPCHGDVIVEYLDAWERGQEE